MDAEEQSHSRARPELRGHSKQDPEEQSGIQHVEAKIYKVMCARIQSKHLHVDHMREHGERVPVRRNRTGEDGHKAIGGNATLDEIVARHVKPVVVTIEVETSYR